MYYVLEYCSVQSRVDRGKKRGNSQSSSLSPPPPAPLPFVVPTSVTATIAAALELLPPAAAEFIDANPIDKNESSIRFRV